MQGRRWVADSKVATVGVMSSTEYNARVGPVKQLIRIHDEVQGKESRKRRDVSGDLNLEHSAVLVGKGQTLSYCKCVRTQQYQTSNWPIYSIQ